MNGTGDKWLFKNRGAHLSLFFGESTACGLKTIVLFHRTILFYFFHRNLLYLLHHGPEKILYAFP
jgi:hypothetical protein